MSMDIAMNGKKIGTISNPKLCEVVRIVMLNELAEMRNIPDSDIPEDIKCDLLKVRPIIHKFIHDMHATLPC